ncbi:MAG: MerR family DNA-binding protein [Acidobacteriota bacterium]
MPSWAGGGPTPWRRWCWFLSSYARASRAGRTATDGGASGYRQYTEAVIDRLQFVKRAKDLGFSLDEIQELLSLKLDPASTSIRVKQRAEAKIADIEQIVRKLQKMKQALQKLTAACSGCGPTSD